MVKVNEDPEYKKLLNKIEKTFFFYKRALADLRNYHFNEETDELRSAVVQNTAHEAEHNYHESLTAFSKYSWELVPHSKTVEHLDLIKTLKEHAKNRTTKKNKKLKFYSLTTKINETVFNEELI